MSGQSYDMPDIPYEILHVVKAWRLMGNRMDWAAMDKIGELMGVVDEEVFIMQLNAMSEGLRNG